MNYRIQDGLVSAPPCKMAYKHYYPEKSSGAILVLICGGGHTMKVWETTPDGRDGWAPIFASNGREVIIVDWVTGPISITQRENMELIKKVVEKEAGDSNRKIVFLGWSMGGPQAFILAADILPEKTVAVLGYGATGPLNSYFPDRDQQKPIDLQSPFNISKATIDRISNSPFFPIEYKDKYIREYLIPFSPLMMAIHSKKTEVAQYWPILTVKNPLNTPPTLLINGSLDLGHAAEKQTHFQNWLKKYQPDSTFVYVKNFPHLGMLCRGNEKIVQLYLDWLKKRGI